MTTKTLINNMGTFNEAMDRLIEAIDKHIENITRKGSNKEKLQYLAWKYGFKRKK